MNNLIEFIKDHLDVKNVGPHILEKVPTLVESAVWELRRSQVIPPKEYTFVSEDKEQIRYDSKGDERYRYYFLPDDFSELEEFFVDDGVKEPIKRVPYNYVPYENYMDTLRTNDNRKFFTITDITLEDKNRKILITNPAPDKNDMVIIKYYVDGTDDGFENVDKRYWTQIRKEIEGELGLRNVQDVDDSRNREISRSKNQQGQGVINKTFRSTRGKFFLGNTGRGKKFGRRKY